MNRVLAAIMAVASCASIAQAAPVVDAPPRQSESIFSLSDALSAAGATAPSLDAASAGLQAAQSARVVAGLRPNPSIVTETENVAGTGVYRGSRSAETTAGLELPIEMGGKRSARIAVANARTDRAQIDQAIASADLRLRVTQAYIEAASAERKVELAKDQLDLANQSEHAAKARVTSGSASPIEQQRADVMRVNAEVGLAAAQRSATGAKQRLALLIGKPVDGALDHSWFERVGIYGPTAVTEVDGTLAYAAAGADLRVADAMVRTARANRVPDITVSASARRLAATNDNAAVFGLTIPFPVFNSGSAALSQAQAERRQAEAQQRTIALEIQREIEAARVEAANAAERARATTGPALAAAAEAARIARIGYAQGKFGQLDLIEAERTLAETRSEAIDALASFHDADARLSRLTAAAPTDIAGDIR